MQQVGIQLHLEPEEDHIHISYEDTLWPRW